MFNVAVLKMKDILKYFVGIILTGLVIFFFCKGLVKVMKIVMVKIVV